MNISCIIPTFERREFLHEALDSVFGQTTPPTEVILVNNGAQELMLPEAYRQRVKVHNIVFRAGASQARNFGAVMATGDYLAFLDDDDIWGSEYLERVSQALVDGAECVVSRLDKMIDGEVRAYKNAAGRLTIKKFLVANPGVTGSNVVIEKKTFMKIGGFDAELPTSNDKSFIIEVLKHQVKTVVLPDNQAVYREHQFEKISNPQKSARGVRRFTEKYLELMDAKAYLINRAKYYRHRWRAGAKGLVVPYAFYSLLAKIF